LQGRTTRRRSSIDLSNLDPNAPNPLEAALPPTLLGQELAARFPTYNTEWRNHLSELFDLPMYMWVDAHGAACAARSFGCCCWADSAGGWRCGGVRMGAK